MNLSKEEATILYEQGVRPAAISTHAGNAAEWPATYAAEKTRARNPEKGFVPTKKIIGEFSIDRFCYHLRQNMKDVEWAKDMFYMTQIRGTKGATLHTPNDEDHASNALNDYTSDINTVDGLWWIDVGVELHHAGEAFQWRGDAHAIVLQNALSVDLGTAGRITSSTTFQNDLSAHLWDLAGFRVRTTSFPNPFQVAYVQIYTTDKAAVYHQQGNRHARFLPGMSALSGTPPEYTRSLGRLYQDCAKHMDCSARMEVRLPITFATQVLQDVDHDFCMRCIVVFPRHVWW